MSNVEESILKALAGSDAVMSDELAQKVGVTHQAVVGASKSLEAEGYITSEIITKPLWKLSDEAKGILKDGSPEFRLVQLLSAKGTMSQPEVQAALTAPVAAVGMSQCLKNKIVKLEKKDGVSYLTVAKEMAADHTKAVLEKANKNEHVDPEDVQNLKRRKLAILDTEKVFKLSKGPSYSEERKDKAVGDITAKMLQDGSWKTANFKEYNFDAAAPEVDGGQLHPLLKTRQEFREIMMELGFQEMNTQHWVESSFWNFDSLFIPQQHPARDAQDTFFISKPATTSVPNREVLAKVKAIHEKSFRNQWCEEESMRNVLRTHTTGTSAYTLHRLAQLSEKNEKGEPIFKPGRYYSIDRVFRNEQMDRTHLCEFHQIEGFVIDRDISLAKMMHTFNMFFRRIGVEKLRFKPAFNPYTEPSMEVFGYHTGLKKWIEVGNSGLFRPELLGPLGLGEDARVMAWGLSLERPTMIKYGINSIHELFGHRVDVKFIKRSAIARF